MAAWGVGFTRLKQMKLAGFAQKRGPPPDMRIVAFPKTNEVLGHITSYLNEIYDSEAEMLPETLEDVDIHWHPDILSEEGVANLGP